MNTVQNQTYQKPYRHGSKVSHGALVALVLSAVLLSSGNSVAEEAQSPVQLQQSQSSTHQFDLQFQHLVKTLSKSLVAVQVASRTSPFQSTMARETTVGSSQPIYLRNVSAIAVDSGGYLICAASLLSDQDSLWLIRDGKRYAVERVGIDFRSGLALLKTCAPNLVLATYVQEPSSSGALTLFLKAAGSEAVEPTLAIASGTSSVDGYLEFSGPVGSGTVGGAFFNMDGELLGLALGSLSADGSSNRVFVLPASRIEPIVTRLKCCGDRQAGYLGIQVANTIIRGLNMETNRSYGSAEPDKTLSHFAADEGPHSFDGHNPENKDVTNGALVTIVERNSPAQKAGLLVGDVVYKYDRQFVESADAFRDYVRGCAPDSVISLDILRGNQKRSVVVSLDRAPLGAANPIGHHSSKSTTSHSELNDYDALLDRVQQLEERLRSLEDNR